MAAEADSLEDELPTPDSAFYGASVRLPGVQDAPNRCRGLSPVGFCEDGHVALGRSSCDTRYCPDHWRGWVRDGTESAVARLAAFRAAEDGWGKRLVHLVASPEVDRVSTERFWSLRSDAQDVLKAAGARGGYCIAHPYRTSDLADRMFSAACEHGNWSKERGRWSFLRDVAGGDWSEWEPLVEDGPHYHFLAACEDFDPSGVPDGWVVKNVRSFSRFEKRDTECYEDMAKAAYYLRTHGAAEDGRQTATWFGEMHPAAFDPEEELGSVEWWGIQNRAAKAVGLAPEEMVGEEEAEEVRCAVDGCGEVVHELDELRTWLSDTSWVSSLPTKRVRRLQGVKLWVLEETALPPPSVRANEEKLRSWLVDTGRMYHGSHTSSPSGLGAFQ
jgi:hypothetical protein